MCLDVVHSLKSKSRKVVHGYQIRKFVNKNKTASYYFNFRMVNKKYYKSPVCKLIEDCHSNSYESGFHIFLTLKSAKKYFSTLYSKADIYKVSGRGILATGRECCATRPKRAKTDCCVCKYMKVEGIANL